jgi:hypothetical protein
MCFTSLSQRIGNLKNLISKSAKKLQANSATLLQNATGKNNTDNKFNYDNKKLSELQSADHDHPLKMSENYSFSNLSVSDCNNEVDQIASEINSVALDWKSLRSASACSCSTPFSQEMKKVRRNRIDDAHYLN